MRPWHIIPSVIVIGLLQVTMMAAARGEEDGELARNARQWQAFYRQRAREFTLEETRDKPVPLTLYPQPIQTWTNPIRGYTQHGTVHLWTHEGRPRAIGSIWSALDPKDRSQRRLCYEFHSLSDMPLTAKHGEHLWWAPQEPGIQYIDLGDVPEPGANRAIRLRQMRDFAKELQAELNQQEGSLRLLPQPLYRYPEGTPGVLDGSIFAFVIATDPELFVIIELHDAKTAGTSGWTLAAARCTGDPIRLRRGERTLWEDPQWEYKRNKIYDFLYGVEQHPDAAAPVTPPE